MSLRRRLDAVEQAVRSQRDPAMERWAEENRRLARTRERFAALVPPDLAEPFADALNGQCDSLHSWVISVNRGASALPGEMTPAVMRRLLDIHLHEKPDSLFKVCETCRLARPQRGGRWEPDKRGALRFIDRPDYFDECPACGGPEWTWITRIEEKHHPWQGEGVQGKRGTGATLTNPGRAHVR